jgi:uncharacterized protein (DUF488 family)
MAWRVPAQGWLGKDKAMTIYTIGYEGATMSGFITALQAAGVRRVIDVRALPLSRRPGFSKSTLAASLKAEGIDYFHLKALGTPKPGRDAAKKGDVATLTTVYDVQLGLPEAQVAAAQMLALADEMPSALLCYERDPCHCHRTLLLEAVGEGREVVDLYV